jgi:hypothetical protein
MKHAAGVSECYRFTDAQENAEAIRHGSNGRDELIEALALNEFHSVEDATVWESADVVNGNDPGMFEESEDARFSSQAAGQVAHGARRLQNFESHAAIEHFVLRRVHHTHTTASNGPEQAVARAGEIRKASAFAQARERLI